MPSQVYFENHLLDGLEHHRKLSPLKTEVAQHFNIGYEDLYATIDGKPAGEDLELQHCQNVVRFFARLVGGKGGFGSMLRAIGAQIEKTTNREACRDLSGRRLRDINEEKRLRKWLEGQSDREKEVEERKQKKLERLLAEPKIDVNLGAPYEKDRQALPERVSAAVDAGLQAAGSSGTKRKAEEVVKAKKKSKLWIDADLSDCSSVSDSDEDEVKKKIESPGPPASTDSGNESVKASVASSSQM